MASLNREQLHKIYYDLRAIYSTCSQSRSPTMRYHAKRAKEAAVLIEGCIGQVDMQPAITWGEPGAKAQGGL